jgi:beta-ribofuranosylaminobenzene 5'-phosphate synthase
VRVANVTAYPRLHFGLIDLGGATYRRYGGCGISVHGLPTCVDAFASRVDDLDTEGVGLDTRGVADLRHLIRRMRTFYPFPCVTLRVRKMPPQHVGLGSKTTLLLAAVAAIDALFDLRLTRQEQQRLSGRGGASGVGIHLFYQGGFLVDAGHPQGTGAYRPSSAVEPHGLPLLLTHCWVPSAWRFILLLPPGSRREGRSEEQFFAQNTPIPEGEVLQSLALVHHGLTPAILEDNLPVLRRSLRDLQTVGFKRREIAGVGAPVQALLSALEAELPSTPVGMSSMGPLVYVIAPHDAVPVTWARLEALCGQGTEILGPFPPHNGPLAIAAVDEP